MSPKKVLSEVWQNLLSHWITNAILPLGTVAVSYWGVIVANWSWPTAIIAAMAMIAFGLVIRDRLFGQAPGGTQTPTLAPNEWLFASDKGDKPPIKIIVTPQGHLLPGGWNDPPKVVIRQHYENDRVELDGKHFINCTFKNVRFVYQGKAPFGFDVDCRVGDPNQRTAMFVQSGHPIILQTVELLKTLRLFHPNAEHQIIDERTQ